MRLFVELVSLVEIIAKVKGKSSDSKNGILILDSNRSWAKTTGLSRVPHAQAEIINYMHRNFKKRSLDFV